MSSETLARTPLTALHEELGARLVEFAGYAMPVQFDGVMAEHNWTRDKAGLFDVSHMGQVWIDGPDWETIARGFEGLVPQNVLGLAPGRQRYGFFTNDTGGIEDDLMFARDPGGDRLFVVVNAACKAADTARMKAALEPELTVTPVADRALVALQGPLAESALAVRAPAVAGTRFMDLAHVEIGGLACLISRSGYTGEDGFEISVPADGAEAMVRDLLGDERVRPIGLGARDSLRLEAGLCLYGQDMDAGLNPVEASLTWAIQKVRRRGGDREGGFPGAETILAALDHGVDRHRVGLKPDGKAPMRHGVALFDQPEGGNKIGVVTSGGFGPTVGGPVAMGLVADGLDATGTRLFGEVRGKRLPVTVAELPFTPLNFKR